MFDSITVDAPAKINLGLRVLPKRGDGYHNIESIFATIGLYDRMTVSLTDKKNTCSVECEGMVLPLENTFTQSYKAFCVLTGTDCGCSVKVTKRIPSGGGLGGGSSDASSFIQSIDSLCGTHLSAAALHALAGQIGSDVYFFTQALIARRKEVDCSFAAVVTGRGEQISRISARADCTVVLVFPGVSVSTKEAYALVDRCGIQNDAVAKIDLEAMYRRPVREWGFVNDFTAPVCAQYPLIAEALEAVKSTGASFADMSGSGSTVFGIYEEREKALQAVNVLSVKKWMSVLA